jgi:hypothetical protein
MRICNKRRLLEHARSTRFVLPLLLAGIALAPKLALATPHEVIHIMGGSGVGKQTLIRRLLNPKEEQLRKRLGIGASVSAFGYAFQHPAGKMLEANTEQVIHQWQFATDHLIEKSLQAFPQAKQRILVLWRPWEVHTRDLRKRSPEWNSTVASVSREWHTGVVPAVQRRMGTGLFDIEVVDASSDRLDPISLTDR